jgi:hypothetical protein
MSLLMPRGVYRACDKDCGYRAFTLHTGPIPCATPGCDGFLAWPQQWPHVCSSGHGAVLEVEGSGRTGHVTPTECPECTTRRR